MRMTIFIRYAPDEEYQCVPKIERIPENRDVSFSVVLS
jgi:hypothetical protein